MQCFHFFCISAHTSSECVSWIHATYTVIFLTATSSWLKKLVTENDAVCYLYTFALALGKLERSFIVCGRFFISVVVLSWVSALLPLFFGSENQMLQVRHLTRGVAYSQVFCSSFFLPLFAFKSCFRGFQFHLYLCFSELC